jgi:hypothetical protein
MTLLLGMFMNQKRKYKSYSLSFKEEAVAFRETIACACTRL